MLRQIRNFQMEAASWVLEPNIDFKNHSQFVKLKHSRSWLQYTIITKVEGTKKFFD